MTTTTVTRATAARVVRVAGTLAVARPAAEASLYEFAYLGERRLLGEVIRLDGDTATLQVYEETTGLRLGEPVQLSGTSLTAYLGPGLLGALLDGVGRRLTEMADRAGDFIPAGATATTLDAARLWRFEPAVRVGEEVTGGSVIGTVEERPGFTHRILVPPTVAGRIASIGAGDFSIEQPVGALEDGTPLLLAHRWPVRVARPLASRFPVGRPVITGQRVLDFLFPVVEGGTATVPGGFGTGKTVLEQSLAKFAQADVVIFVGCGERGNEIADVLHEFPSLRDPVSGRSLMDRAVLVVNTSNMPVAAREASIYLGITIAEYYRDMGYRVALMVDSTSRWAEALREIAARLQEMPGEEGFPTYLASRLGKLFERAGRGRPLGTPEREGSVTFIGAISPPGGDFSEPVTQAALRVTGALWALDPALAHQRHYPAVDWATSYSLYAKGCAEWFAREVAADWPMIRRELITLLQREQELRDIAGLIGPEALEDRDRLVMELAAATREVFLRQSAYHPNDARSTLAKTHALASTCLALYRGGLAALAAGAEMSTLDLASARRALAELRDAADADVGERTRSALEVIERMGRAGSGAR